MILVDEFIKLKVSEEFLNMFLVVIQLGAILAVVYLFFEKLNPFSKKKNVEQRKETWHIWYKTLIGCLPAAIIGLFLDDWLNKHFYNYVIVALALISYGIIFILIEKRNKVRDPKITLFSELSYLTAFKIGIFQVLSLIPGTSRSGSTIIGGILCGTSRYIATEFSFFMSIPIMFGASLLKILHFGFHFTKYELSLLSFGMIVAFIISVLTINFLISYLKTNDFKIFGYYRIFLGMLVIIYFFLA